MKKRLLLCSTITLLIFTAVSCKKSKIDPKTLIGTWKGRIWTGKDSMAIGSTKGEYTIVLKADSTLTYEKKYNINSLTGNGAWTLNSNNFMEATNSDPFGSSSVTKLKAKATNTKIAGTWGSEGSENGFYVIKQ